MSTPERAALRAIVAATECLDGARSYIGLSECIAEIQRIAQLALDSETRERVNTIAYLAARLEQMTGFLERVASESHDRHAVQLATLGRDGIKCRRCRVETLDGLDAAKAVGWTIYHSARDSYFLCPDHAAADREWLRTGRDNVMRPQSMEDGPERGVA